MIMRSENLALPEIGRDDIPVEELYDDPRWLIYCVDADLRRAYFVALNREAYHRSCFLDPRMAHENPTLHSTSMGALEALHAARQRQPVFRFIFHTAFCCSSLLARSLDFPGRTLAIREPTMLVQIANATRNREKEEGDYVARALPLALSLLNKPFANEQVFVKPTNVATNCAASMLAASPDSRGLVLWGGLVDFLISALKRPQQSAEQLPTILNCLLADPIGKDWALAGEPAPSTLAQQAALVWHLEMHQLAQLLSSHLGPRLRVLATDALLSRPVESIGAVAKHLNLDVTSTDIHAMVNGPTWRSHAKTGEQYGPGKRQEEKDLAQRLFSDQIGNGLSYARKLSLSKISLPTEFDIFHSTASH